MMHDSQASNSPSFQETAVFFRHREDGRTGHVIIEGDRAQVAVQFPVNSEMTFQNGADLWPIVITEVGDPPPEPDYDDE